jgi:hypothetical protein
MTHNKRNRSGGVVEKNQHNAGIYKLFQGFKTPQTKN